MTPPEVLPIIRLRQELRDTFERSLDALTAYLVASTAHQPASAVPTSPQQAEPGGVSGQLQQGGSPALSASLDVSSLKLAPAEPAPPVPFLRDYAGSSWSDERRKLLARDWVKGRDVHDITADLNALPGEPVTAKQVGVYAASSLKLRRPEWFNALRSRMRKSTPVPAPATEPEPVEPLQAAPEPEPIAADPAPRFISPEREPNPARPPTPIVITGLRDGAPSVAAAEERHLLHNAETVPVDRMWAVRWARENKVEPPPGKKLSLAIINQTRAQMALPPFRLVLPLGEQRPDQHTGGRP